MKTTTRTVHLGAFAIALVAALGAKCPSIPEIQERAVQLVKTESMILTFQAKGADTGEDGSVDLVAEYDIAGAIEDAGLDVSDVEGIKLRTVAARVSMPDAVADRMLVDGAVAVQRTAREGPGGCGVGSGAQLVSGITIAVNQQTEFDNSPDVSPAGTAFIECLMNEYLDAIKAGNNPDSMVIMYTVTGSTTPTDPPANFQWQLKVVIDIIGTLHIDVLG